MKPIIASPTACILVSIVRSNDAALIKVTIGRQHSKQRYTVTVGVLPPTSVEVCNYIVSVFTIAPFVECRWWGSGFRELLYVCYTCTHAIASHEGSSSVRFARVAPCMASLVSIPDDIRGIVCTYLPAEDLIGMARCLL